MAALKLKLFGEERAAVLKRYTDNAEAYELFLKGRHHSYKYTAQGWQRAIEFFEKAIALEPDYALAYAGIAASRGCQWFFGILPAERVIPQCKAGNAQALAIDGGLADAYFSLVVDHVPLRLGLARRRADVHPVDRAQPEQRRGSVCCALFLVFDGRVEEAMALCRKALALDPLAPLINMNVGWTYFAAGRPAEASQQAAKMVESNPDFYGAYWLQGAIHLSAGEYQAAVSQLRSAVSLGGHQVVVADLASACSLAGATAEATAILDRLVDLRAAALRASHLPGACPQPAWEHHGGGRSVGSKPPSPNATARWCSSNRRSPVLPPTTRCGDWSGEPRVRALLDSMRPAKTGVTSRR